MKIRESHLVYIGLIIACLFLAGCATPSGQLTKNDFNWSAREVPINYQEAYRRMYRGITSEGIWVVEGNLYSELGKGVMDLYGKDMFNNRGDIVFGRIVVSKKADSVALVEFGDNNFFPNGDRQRKVRERYLKYLDNNAE